MPFLKVQLPAPAPIARPRRALAGYHDAPWLTQWPDGVPLTTLGAPRECGQVTLGEYTPAPWQKFINGVPMTAAPDSAMVPKSELVRMALRISLQKKCCSLSGLGDNGDSGDDSGGDVSVIIPGGAPEDVGTSADVPTSIAYEPAAPITVPAASSSGGYTYDPSTGVLTPTGTPVTTGNALSNFFSSLLAPLVGSRTTPAAGYTYNPATGRYVYTGGGTGLSSLAQPISPGSSLTMGGLLAIGGVAVALAFVAGGTKVSRRR